MHRCAKRGEAPAGNCGRGWVGRWVGEWAAGWGQHNCIATHHAVRPQYLRCRGSPSHACRRWKPGWSIVSVRFTRRESAGGGWPEPPAPKPLAPKPPAPTPLLLLGGPCAHEASLRQPLSAQPISLRCARVTVPSGPAWRVFVGLLSHKGNGRWQNLLSNGRLRRAGAGRRGNAHVACLTVCEHAAHWHYRPSLSFDVTNHSLNKVSTVTICRPPAAPACRWRPPACRPAGLLSASCPLLVSGCMPCWVDCRPWGAGGPPVVVREVAKPYLCLASG
jgi:hypothetical protein